MVEGVVPDRAAEGAKDVVGIVVGTGHVAGFAVASECDRAGAGPWPEVRAGLLEVGVWSESEFLGVSGCSEHEVLYEFDRRGDWWGVIAAEDLLGKAPQRLLVDAVGSDRVLDPEAVRVD